MQATEDLQDPGRRRNVVARLMRYTGWSRDHALRAIAEYHRFGELSRHCDHPVVPSMAVDWVWHLHLLDTRDYWERYCPQVLGGPLHHVPSLGSPTEAARNREHYAATLRSYARLFGHAPDPRIWPIPARRFASREQVVDLSECRVLRRRRRSWSPGLTLGLALLLVPGLANAATETRSVSLPGTLAWVLVVLLASVWIRRVLRRVPQTRSAWPMDPVALALLASGIPRATDVLLAGMLLRGELQVQDDRLVHGHHPRPADPEAALVWDDAWEGLLPHQAARLSRPNLRARITQLREAGWLCPASAEGVRLGMVGLAAAGMMALVAAWLWLDQISNRVSSSTLFTAWMCAGVVLHCGFRRLGTTLPGQHCLRALQQRLIRLRHAACRDELELALALFGLQALAGTALEPFRQLRAGGHTWEWPFNAPSGCSEGPSGGETSPDGNGPDGDGCGGGGCGGD